MTSKKNPFIEGFKEPTLSRNSFMTLADVRGDGEGKLVIWSQQQSELIVYKGSNRQLQKPFKLKNVSGIIQYQDQQSNSQAVIGLSAQNGFYIFRSLAESFRLRVPDICADTDQQLVWSQYQQDPQRLKDQLLKINKKVLSETAKYYIGAQTIERKRELIQKVFDQGINEKDSISAMALLRVNQSTYLGNVILGTELQRLYILDNYGHSIISQRIIPVVPAIILAHGTLLDKHIIILIGREGDICIYLNKDLDQPSQIIKNSTRIISASLSFPDLILVGADQTVTHYVLSNSNFKLMAKKYTMKMGNQPIKAEFLKVKGQKMTILAFQNQVRFYNEKELNYTYVTQFNLYNIIWGSFARQECCLILLYENAGFQVLILHRQFKINQKYGSNKVLKEEFENIPIPKKTPHFLTYWNDNDSDQALLYKHFEKNLKLLKWRTLRQKYSEGNAKANGKIEINSKILGLGPIFNIQLQLQNLSEEILFNVSLMINYDKQKIQLQKWENNIYMLSPFTPTVLQFQIRSLSFKNESITIELLSGKNVVITQIYIPNCEEFGDN